MRYPNWRRWRPRQRSVANQVLDSSWPDLYLTVESRLNRIKISKRKWREKRDMSELDALIDGARGHAVGLEKQNSSQFEKAEAWLYALVLQAPRAAVAQKHMDEHPESYRDKDRRLMHLIDFNDAFDSTVLVLPSDMMAGFPDRVKRMMDEMCKRVGTRSFSNEQYDAVVRGLSREIAVFLGAQKEGFDVEMTNRHEDAFGIDMRVVDPKVMRAINIDIKTRSSYHYRVDQLHREGRLDDEGLMMADRNGFTAVINGRDHERRRVVTWRIDHELYGEVVDFEFKDTRKLGETLRVLMLRYGEAL